MITETTTPVAPADEASDLEDEQFRQLHTASLEEEIRRLLTENAALRTELDEARGVHQPKPFPCAVYRGGQTMEAVGPAELSALISKGWSEIPV